MGADGGAGLDGSNDGAGLDGSNDGAGLDGSDDGAGLNRSNGGAGLDGSNDGAGLGESRWRKARLEPAVRHREMPKTQTNTAQGTDLADLLKKQY